MKQPKYHEYFEPWERVARRYGTSINTDVLMRADLGTYLSENCLVKTDRASMLASLEVRVPFLDELVLDRILPLHANRKIVDGTLKALLMPIARRLLPSQVWDRPKHGFHVPLDRFLSGIWRPAVETALDWGESHVDLFDYAILAPASCHQISAGGIDRELWNPVCFSVLGHGPLALVMKVAFLNDRIYGYASSDPSAVGGSERQQWLLARALASSGWTVYVGIRQDLKARGEPDR